MDTIIFLCTGNTCRSPMAEGLFHAHNGEEKTGLTAASAGLYTENGLPASANAVAAAGERGADISAHRSRQLTAEMALLHHDNVHRLRFLMTACTPLSISAAERR